MMIEALDDKGALSVDALCKYVQLPCTPPMVTVGYDASQGRHTTHGRHATHGRRHVQLRWRRMSCDVKRYRVTDKLKRMMGKQARARVLAPNACRRTVGTMLLDTPDTGSSPWTLRASMCPCNPALDATPRACDADPAFICCSLRWTTTAR